MKDKHSQTNNPSNLEATNY